MEQHCVQCKAVCWLKGLLISSWSMNEIKILIEEHQATEVHQNDHDNNLIESLPENLSPHFRQNHFVVSADSTGGYFIWFIWLCANGNSSQDVHDKVGPQHLNDVQWLTAQCSSTQNGDRTEDDVDSHLELEEFSGIIKDRSSPLYRLIN